MLLITDSKRAATTLLMLSLLVLTGFLTGCQSVLDKSPLVKRVTEATKLAVGGLEDINITRQQVDNIPYASMLAKVGRGGWVLMILAEKQGDELTWISNDKGILVTKNGRIIKTAGFKLDLDRTKFQHSERSAANVRYIDLRYRDAFLTPVFSQQSKSAAQDIEILDKIYQVQKVTEINKAPEIDIKYGSWRFENIFYQDIKTGYIWKTKQYVTPDLPVFETMITKPAG